MIGQLISWLVTALVLTLAISFVVYLFAIALLPDERPTVVTFDRRGRVIGRFENPGEQIAPGRHGDPIGGRPGAGPVPKGNPRRGG